MEQAMLPPLCSGQRFKILMEQLDQLHPDYEALATKKRCNFAHPQAINGPERLIFSKEPLKHIHQPAYGKQSNSIGQPQLDRERKHEVLWLKIMLQRWREGNHIMKLKVVLKSLFFTDESGS